MKAKSQNQIGYSSGILSMHMERILLQYWFRCPQSSWSSWETWRKQKKMCCCPCLFSMPVNKVVWVSFCNHQIIYSHLSTCISSELRQLEDVAFFPTNDPVKRSASFSGGLGLWFLSKHLIYSCSRVHVTGCAPTQTDTSHFLHFASKWKQNLFFVMISYV